MAENLFESYENSNTDVTVLPGALKKAQSFTPQITHTLTKVSLKLKRNTDGSDYTYSVKIQAMTIGPAIGPTGVDLTSETVDWSSVPTTAGGTWVDVTFTTPIVLTAGVEYAIIPLGSEWYTNDDGANWASDGNNKDFAFREYGLWDVSGVVPDTDRTYIKSLVAVGSDTLFYESSSALTELVAVRTEGLIDCSNLLQICEAYQKVFIANEGILRVADFGNVKIVAANIVSGGVYPRKGALLTSGTSSMVVDYITSTTGGSTIYGQNITGIAFSASDAVTGTNLDGTSVGFTMTGVNEVAGPHWYTWAVYGALAATYGTMPGFASLICNYRGRIVISGNKQYPFQWYMARQSHPFDFNYTSNDAQTAVAGSNADAGELGDIITALIPYKDDYLVFGCGGQIWYMAGDPAAGGSLNELDLTTGIYGPQSWCFDNAGNLYFWGTNGVYRTTIPGVPENISRVYLPNLVKDEAIDSSTHRITMAYDSRRGGILIAITKFSDNTHSNYFFDLATNGFFPESSATTDCAIYSQLFYKGDAPDYRRLLFGCADGYVRYHDEDTKSDVDADDVATAIDAYCTWGPLKLAQDEDFYGVLSALEIITAGGASGGSQSDSNNVSYNIFVADTAEEILEKLSANTDYRVTGTVTAPGRPKGSRIRKRFRGMYLGLRLWNSTAAEAWSVNKIIGTIKAGGKFR
ncbi:hypothetical protein LCGC14_1338860 [marine sediment metagenome]|uniref:Uncharacterized protein n=1 Tax=marine sediment metagenome TaxID=412755 RepID=A0A0F9L0N1_9ZZZZ